MPSKEYKQLLDDAWDLHVGKNAGYAGADNPDPWANFRASEAFNVSAFDGCMVRLSDKYLRVTNLMKSADNERVGESIRDTLRDLSAYALIAVCLLDEKNVEAKLSMNKEFGSLMQTEHVPATFLCGHRYGEEPGDYCGSAIHWSRVEGIIEQQND